MILKVQKLSESDILSDHIQGFRAMRLGFFFRVNNAGIYDPVTKAYRRPGKNYTPGVSDIMGVLGGTAIAIETKNIDEFKWITNFKNRIGDNWKKYCPVGKKEEHVINQMIFIDEFNRNAGVAFFSYSFTYTLQILAPILIREGHEDKLKLYSLLE